MVEDESARYNFNISSSPANPLNGRPIVPWYRPGQNWTDRFAELAELATTVDESRAELVGAYLELGRSGFRGLRGYNEESGVSCLSFVLGVKAASNILFYSDGYRLTAG
jgi:dipeptidyl-peptidase III